MVSINWKKSIIPITLALTLLMSTAAFAISNVNDERNKKNFSRLRTAITERTHFGKEWAGKRGKLPEELKAKIAELKEKLKSGEITREQFWEEMKKIMPERFQFKGRKLPEELKAKIAELKEKLKSGEITREQFWEEMKKIMPERFQFKGRKLPEELKAKIAELKEKLKSGEITRKQFWEEMKQLKQE
ncbi:MAG: SHOCT domain-containing protein [Thermoanaerobacteraceae bacterium]|nr:SHOCT domain-containing protein [Thermoanaerobacteraceae bacterium]